MYEIKKIPGEEEKRKKGQRTCSDRVEGYGNTQEMGEVKELNMDGNPGFKVSTEKSQMGDKMFPEFT